MRRNLIFMGYDCIMGYVCSLVYAIKCWTISCLALVLLPAKTGVVTEFLAYLERRLDSYGALGCSFVTFYSLRVAFSRATPCSLVGSCRLNLIP